MNSVTDWLVQNRDKVEKGVEILGQASAVLATTVGQLHPILKAVFQGAAELLNNPQSNEARDMTEQFTQLHQKLEGTQAEMNEILLKMEISSMNKQNFDYAENILNQYENFEDFVSANPDLKEKKKNKLIDHYEKTQGDLNLEVLYKAVIEENMSGKQMLKIVLDAKKKSRREVEDFCAELKKLFLKGMIVVICYTAFKKGKEDGEKILKKWLGEMEEVEKLMKEAVEDCRENFAHQAKEDMEGVLRENASAVNQEIINKMLEALMKKYDWVNWSIRAFNEKERCFLFNWLAGDRYHGISGAKWFEISSENKIKVVVSYCIEPKPIDKAQIQEEIEQQEMKGDMEAVAQSLNSSIPNCLVHAISTYKDVAETNNFHEGCFYIMKHKQAYICIHPE